MISEKPRIDKNYSKAIMYDNSYNCIIYSKHLCTYIVPQRCMITGLNAIME